MEAKITFTEYDFEKSFASYQSMLIQVPTPACSGSSEITQYMLLHIHAKVIERSEEEVDE